MAKGNRIRGGRTRGKSGKFVSKRRKGVYAKK